LEICADLLWRLGILKPLDEENGWACCFTFECPPQEAYARAIDNAAKGPTFDHMVGGMFYFMNDHVFGGSCRETGVEFSVLDSHEMVNLMNSFAALGLVETRGARYIWTEKITPFRRPDLFGFDI
jgi:hypothetical protein